MNWRDFDRTLNRLTGNDRPSADRDRERLLDRQRAERREHKFSDTIGGDSSNYREPKFGSRH